MAELETVLLSSLLADDKAIAVGVMYPGEDTPMGVPLIRVADIVDGRISSTIGYRISEEVNSQYRRTQLSGDEVMMTLVGRPGTAIKVPVEMRGWNAARALAVLRLADPEERDFFVYSVASPQVQHTIRNWCNTTVQATLNLKEIKALPLPWPDRSTRRAIAATLGALGDKIELNRKMNATLEAMARALFRDWFVDFGPTRAKMEGRTPYLSPDLWSLFPARLDDEGKPEGWEVGTIANCTKSISSGGTPQTTKPSYWGGHIPWLSSGETRNLVVLETERTITEEGVKSSSTRLAPKGSTVIASAGQGNTRGQASLLSRDMYINQSVIAAVADEQVTSATLLFLDLSRRYEELRQISDSNSSRGSLTTKMVAALKTVIAPKQIVAAFEGIAGPIMDRIVQNERGSRTLARTRDLLLPRLMSGELRVGVTEGVV